MTKYTMTLFSAPGTCATAVHIALQWIGAPHTVIHLNQTKMKSLDYLALNPSGVVPTLIDGDLTLSEASAILMYLVDHFPNAGIGQSTGTENRVSLNQWLLFLSATLHPAFWPYFAPQRYTTNNDDHEHVVKAAEKLAHKALTQIEDHLEGGEWMVGDARSVADALLYPMASWAYGFPGDFAGTYPNIDRLIRKLAADPAVKIVHSLQRTTPKVSVSGSADQS